MLPTENENRISISIVLCFIFQELDLSQSVQYSGLVRFPDSYGYMNYSILICYTLARNFTLIKEWYF